jgi:hypothetical protein
LFGDGKPAAAPPSIICKVSTAHAEKSQSTEIGKRDFIGEPIDLWPVAETAKLIGYWAPAFWPPPYGLLGDEDAGLLWV